MKTSNKLILLTFFMIIVYSFSLAFTVQKNRYIKEDTSIIANQEFITQIYPLGRVDEIQLGGRIDFEIIQTDSNYAEVTVPKNLDTLVIVEKSIFKTEIFENYSIGNIDDYSNVKVKLGLKNPKKMILYPGNSTIDFANRFVTDQLEITLGASGTINLDINADRLNLSCGPRINCTLKGDINILLLDLNHTTTFDASQCEINHLDLKKSGFSEIDFTVNESYRYDTTKIENVQIRGDAIFSE